MRILVSGLLAALALVCGLAPLAAQEGHDHHASNAGAGVKPPKLFLDKPAKIVEYQLKRLSNAELMLAERKSDDPKYIPVYAAILARGAIPAGDRRAAAEALAKLKGSSVVAELLSALQSLPNDDAEAARSARDLTQALLAEPPLTLADQATALTGTLESPSAWARRAALAAMLTAGLQSQVTQHAARTPDATIDMLVAITWLGDPAARQAQRPAVMARLDASQPVAVRQQAIRTLATISSLGADKFARLAALMAEEPLRDDAVRALLTVPAPERDAGISQALAERLVAAAEATPIDQRTSDRFVDAAQLVDSLLADLPAEVSRALRGRMQAVAVRVVRIRTVEEEMRYDIKYFAVEAGRPVEIVLRNDDIMPHNLVLTLPGSLKEVALSAAAMAPDQTTDGKQYVPASDKVLWATTMVPAGKQERLAFAAPAEPGEYPYVCTFPNHWMRMYGVMLVVPDLDAWQRQPKPPADPIGNNRSFVRKWTVNDLAPDLEAGLRGRNADIGARLLKEATCLQCHKMRGEGGTVGPDLSDVAKRWKGDHRAILQEILDPSHKIEPKYAMQQVLMGDGRVYSGIVVEETKDSLSLLSSPDQPMPVKLARDDIDEVVRSSKSIMPVGLLDQYTKDEIFEILALLSQQ